MSRLTEVIPAKNRKHPSQLYSGRMTLEAIIPMPAATALAKYIMLKT
jgi:hypothetical protein